jgi:tetratricopeptide (TPR) repeat protein
MSRRVFISHGADGVEFARALKEWLETREIRAWMPGDPEAGEDLAERIRLELGRATHAVIVLTDTRPSPRLRLEWSELLERRSMDPRMQLIPVQLGDRPPPPFLRDTNAVMASGGRGEWEHAMATIGESLEGEQPIRQEDTSGLSERLEHDLEKAARRPREKEALRLELAAAELALDRGHTTGDGQRLAELLGRVGMLRLHLEDAEDAIEPLELAQRLLVESPGVAPEERVSTAYCLGNALSRVGRVDEAAALLRSTVLESARTDVDEFTTAALAFRAGQEVEGAGDNDFAQQLFYYAQSLAEPLLGPDHPTVAAYRRAAEQQS